MADRLSTEQRRLNMSRVLSRNTAPEIIVRRLLHSVGYRFRLHRRDLPGTPDIVLPKHGVAIFVHGCFWHGHNCPLFRLPETRPDFWSSKIEGNRMRDKAARRSLLELEWRSITVWECAVRGRWRLERSELAAKVTSLIEDSRTGADIEGGFPRTGVLKG
jgi:DNA mismatch endonuclease (patch repair protein)